MTINAPPGPSANPLPISTPPALRMMTVLPASAVPLTTVSPGTKTIGANGATLSICKRMGFVDATVFPTASVALKVNV